MRGNLVLIVSAYGDESGTNAGDEVYVVAIYASTIEKWQAFSRCWGQMLYEFRIPYYHAAELEAFWKSPTYKRIIRDRDTLVKLQSLAFPLIKAHAEKGVGVAVIKKDFLDVLHPAHGEDELYSFCAQECMRGMMFWLTRERHSSGVINYVFECGARGWGIFESHTESPIGRAKFKVGTITRAGKQTMFPLQAADALAFEVYKEMVNGVLYRRRKVPRVRQPRKSALVLLRPRKDTFTYYDAKRLTDIFIRKLKRPEAIGPSS